MGIGTPRGKMGGPKLRVRNEPATMLAGHQFPVYEQMLATGILDGEPLRKKIKLHVMEGADVSVQDALESGVLTRQPRGSEVEWKCTICLCLLKGAVPAAQHLKGESHAKVFRRHCSQDNPTLPQHSSKVPTGLPEKISTALEEGYLRPFIKDGHQAFHCDACRAPMTGIEPTIAHLKGDKHTRRLSSMKLLNNLPDAPTMLQQLDKEHSPTSTSPDANLEEELKRGVVKKTLVMGALHFSCTICNVSMAGEVPVRHHLNGKPHKKSCARRQMYPDCSSLSYDSLPSSNSSFETATPHTSATAQPGSDSFNSQLLSSLACLDVSNGTDAVAAALSSGTLKEVSRGAYVCLVCPKGSVMCGRPPAEAHLGGAPHAKASAKARIMASLRPSCSTPKRESSDTNPAPNAGLSTSTLSTSLFRPYTPAESSFAADSTDGLPKENDEDLVAEALAKGVLMLKPDLENKFECRVCSKVMVGKIPAAAHLSGAAHFKALKKGGESKDNSFSSSTSNNLLVSSSTRADDFVTPVVLDGPRLYCEVCCVSFRSMDAFNTHLGCEAHLLAQKKLDDKLKPVEVVVKSTSAILSALPVDSGQLDLMEFVRQGEIQVLMRGSQEMYRCLLCQIDLTSVAHLRGHLLGRAHPRARECKIKNENTSTEPSSVTVMKQEQGPPPNGDDDDRSSSGSESSDSEPIVIGEHETPDTNPAFLAFIAKIERKKAKKEFK